MRKKFSKQSVGFTLVEVLIVIGIFGVLSAMVITRYSRGNEDSLLTRQVAQTIADIRLAQEQTASGASVRYCTFATGKLCTKDSDCPLDTCSIDPVTPPGGMAVLFSCPSTAYTQQQLYFIEDKTTKYYTYADAVACKTGVCFEPAWGIVGEEWIIGASDGLISSYVDSTYLRGDPLFATHAIVPKVEIKDLQLVESVTNAAFNCTTGSPWNGNTNPEPIHNDLVPADYPLQALVRFPAPDGRKTMISDNISSTTPLGNAWARIDIMLGLTARASDCRVISITKEGVISQSVDANCDFAT